MRFKASRWPGYGLAFVFVFFFALSLRQLVDEDVWFQLLTGQETVRTLAVPRTEFYIYSALSEPSLFVGWLWGLWLYLAWLAGGYTAVSIFGALVWGAIFAIGAKAIVTFIERDVPGGEVPKVRSMARLWTRCSKAGIPRRHLKLMVCSMS